MSFFSGLRCHPRAKLLKKFAGLCAALLTLVLALGVRAGQAVSPSKTVTAPVSDVSSSQTGHGSSPQFVEAADQVLSQMSKQIGRAHV